MWTLVRTRSSAALFGLAAVSLAFQGLTLDAWAGEGVRLPKPPAPGVVAVPSADARGLLAMAQTAFRNGQHRRAQHILRVLALRFPGSRRAADGVVLNRRIIAAKIASTRFYGLGRPPTPSQDRSGLVSSPVILGWSTDIAQWSAASQDAFADSVGDRVFFDAGRVTLERRARRVLDAQARWLAAHPNVMLQLIGHTDDPGSVRNHMRLSRARALAVRDYLLARGVARHRLRAVGQANRKPVALCRSENCRAQNRRVVSEVRVRGVGHTRIGPQGRISTSRVRQH